MAVIHNLKSDILGYLSADSNRVYKNENIFQAVQNYAGVGFVAIPPSRNLTSLSKVKADASQAVAYHEVGVPFDLYYAALKSSLTILNSNSADTVSQFWVQSFVNPNLIDVTRIANVVDVNSTNPGFADLRFTTGARTAATGNARYGESLVGSSSYSEKLYLHSDLSGKTITLNVYDNTLTFVGAIATATINSSGLALISGTIPPLTSNQKYFFRYEGGSKIFDKSIYPVLHVDITMSSLFAKDNYAFIAA